VSVFGISFECTVGAVPSATTFALFSAAALALIVVPGPAVTYVVTQSLDKGRSAGLVSALGIACGGLVHVAAAAVGLSALIASSADAFTVVKLVGAAYLIALGLLRLAGRGENDDEEAVAAAPRRLFWQGALVNVLNPKTALFFLAFLPQFVDPGRGPVALQAALLGTVFVVLATFSDSTYAVVAAALAERVRGSRRARQVRRYVSGSIFVALGATAAAARRT
jgi:threonine/homoserine/homoserine lactone efflux protein